MVEMLKELFTIKQEEDILEILFDQQFEEKRLLLYLL